MAVSLANPDPLVVAGINATVISITLAALSLYIAQVVGACAEMKKRAIAELESWLGAAERLSGDARWLSERYAETIRTLLGAVADEHARGSTTSQAEWESSLPPSALTMIVQARQQMAGAIPQIADNFFAVTSRLGGLASDVRTLLDQRRAYLARVPKVTLVSLMIATTITFVCGVVAPMVLADVPGVSYLWIPLAYYVGASVFACARATQAFRSG